MTIKIAPRCTVMTTHPIDPNRLPGTDFCSAPMASGHHSQYWVFLLTGYGGEDEESITRRGVDVGRCSCSRTKQRHAVRSSGRGCRIHQRPSECQLHGFHLACSP